MSLNPFSKPSELDELLARLKDAMDNQDDQSSETYSQLADQYVKLRAVKANEAKTRISPDALVGAAASLIGIVIVISSEHVGNIVTSKAFGMVKKS